MPVDSAEPSVIELSVSGNGVYRALNAPNGPEVRGAQSDSMSVGVCSLFSSPRTFASE